MFHLCLTLLTVFVQTPAKKKLDIVTVASNYHMEVNPSDVGIYDRVVVQEMIKTVASTHQLDAAGQRDFKGRSKILPWRPKTLLF